jgi:benzoate membrane transport protein
MDPCFVTILAIRGGEHDGFTGASSLPATSLRRVIADFGPVYAASGFIGFIFAASGPTAIILSVGTRAGLSNRACILDFRRLFINGIITFAMSWKYCQPLCLFWTIPGTVLVGPLLSIYRFRR